MHQSFSQPFSFSLIIAALQLLLDKHLKFQHILVTDVILKYHSGKFNIRLKLIMI